MPPAVGVSVALEQIRQAEVVRLEIASNLPRADSWAPHQHAPVISLSRVDLANLPEGELPERPYPIAEDDGDGNGDTDADTDPARAPAVVALTEYLGGAIDEEALACDAYRAQLRDGRRRIRGLVVKILDADFFPPKASAYSEFINEGRFFNMAASVQGVAVPRYCGLFARGTVYCHIFEDAGRELTDEEASSKEIQDQVVEALKLIHGTGVVNAAYHRQDIRRHPQGHIMFSTLFGAATLHKYTAAFCREWASRNKKLVGKTREEVLAYRGAVNIERTLDEFPVDD